MTSHTLPPITSGEQPPAPRPKRFRWLVGLAVLLVAAAAGRVLLSPEETKAALPESDVPKVEGDTIGFSEAFAKRAGLRTVAVELHSFKATVSAVGTTEFDPNQLAVVGTRLRGMVGRVFHFEGDSVTKGEVLATIESPELAEAQATVEHYAAEKEAAQLNAKREADLTQRNLSTAREAEVAAVELRKFEALWSAARQRVRALSGSSATVEGTLGIQELRSPIAGTVVEVKVATGQSVEGNHAAFTVANLDRLWVDVRVFDKSLPLVRLDDRVELKTLSGSGDVLEGRVARLGAIIDPETRTTSVRVEIDNRARKLRAGQPVNAIIFASGKGDAVANLVPQSAITYVDGNPTVFVMVEPNRVKVRKVKLGSTSGTLVEITEGLGAGEQVVNEGAFALKSELFR